MKKVKVLDCTLRDGGYANNWRFGKEAIIEIKDGLEKAGVDFVELGIMKNIEYEIDRSIFSRMAQVEKILEKPHNSTQYCVFIQMSDYYPLKLLKKREPNEPQMIRYAFWKRLKDEAYEYAQGILEKGYQLSCQPTRVEQYSNKDFAELCVQFSKLKPYAFYIVDTFGLLREDDLLRYSKIANEYLEPGIVLGYHAHDNMGQAFRNVCSFLEQDFDGRVIQIDASILGMGRGSGNLRLEQILEHLNHNIGTSYNLAPIFEIYDKHISRMMKENRWGYDLSYFIAAMNGCNPNYPLYYKKKGLNISQIEKALISIQGEDKIIYNDKTAEKYLHQII